MIALRTVLDPLLLSKSSSKRRPFNQDDALNTSSDGPPVSLAHNSAYHEAVKEMDLVRAMIHIERCNCGSGHRTPFTEVLQEYKKILDYITNHQGIIQTIKEKCADSLGDLGPLDSLLKARRISSLRHWRKGCIANGTPTVNEGRTLMLLPLSEQEKNYDGPEYTEVEAMIALHATTMRTMLRAEAILQGGRENSESPGNKSRGLVHTSMEVFIQNEEARLRDSGRFEQSQIDEIREQLFSLLEKYFPKKEMDSELSKAA